MHYGVAELQWAKDTKKLEQLERLRSEDTPRRLLIIHTIESYLDPKSTEDKVKIKNLKNLPKLQNVKFWNKIYMWHTFWSCLIGCANM